MKLRCRPLAQPALQIDSFMFSEARRLMLGIRCCHAPKLRKARRFRSRSALRMQHRCADIDACNGPKQKARRGFDGMARGVGSPRRREEGGGRGRDVPRQLCRFQPALRGPGMRPPQGWHMSCSCDGGLAGSLAIKCFRLARLRQAMEATGADSWACRLMAVG